MHACPCLQVQVQISYWIMSPPISFPSTAPRLWNYIPQTFPLNTGLGQNCVGGNDLGRVKYSNVPLSQSKVKGSLSLQAFGNVFSHYCNTLHCFTNILQLASDDNSWTTSTNVGSPRLFLSLSPRPTTLTSLSLSGESD